MREGASRAGASPGRKISADEVYWHGQPLSSRRNSTGAQKSGCSRTSPRAADGRKEDERDAAREHGDPSQQARLAQGTQRHAVARLHSTAI